MKVLHVIDNGRIGGAQALLADVLPRLNSFGIKGQVIILGEGEWLATQLSYAKVPVKVLNLPRWKWESTSLVELVQAFQPDVIHTHLFKSAALAAYLERRHGVRIPIVFHDHQGFYPQNWKFYHPFPVPWILKHVYQKMLSHTSQVIVLTEGMKQRYEQVYPYLDPYSIVVLPNVISPHKRTINCEDFRKRRGLSPKAPMVLMVGRFAQEKRWDLFVQLAHQCQEENIIFVGIGTGRLFSKINQQVRALKLRNVFLLGSRQDVDCFLRQSTICVLTSVRETFSLYAIEAMRWKCPLIAMYNGGTEYIVEHGRTGFLVPFGQVNEMCILMKRLLSSPEERKRIALLAQEEVLRKYTVEAVLPQWINLYQKLR